MQPEDDVARQITRGVTRYFRNLNNATLTELVFADGRRCDVITVDEMGVISIVEIKSSIADFRSDSKWPQYRQWCDRYYFAVETSFPRELIPDDCGLILADGYGADIFREAEKTRLNAARRKALMLRFARAAAFRLQDKNDPDRL
ncbi:MAG: MmcB family DNA repair protein [Hyphomicrobiales bacterium]|nr:MmcB family DNA repair protein [Hyphomicrobiales bacterium]